MRFHVLKKTQDHARENMMNWIPGIKNSLRIITGSTESPVRDVPSIIAIKLILMHQGNSD